MIALKQSYSGAKMYILCTVTKSVVILQTKLIARSKWFMLIKIVFHNHHHSFSDEKKFDVFLSYVWSPTSADLEGGRTLSSPSGPDTAEEGGPRCSVYYVCIWIQFSM